MNKSTKWILGIVIGLVCVAALVAAGFVMLRWWGGSGWMMESRGFRTWGDGPIQPWQRMPMHPNSGLPFSSFGGFSPIRMISVGLLCLGFLALIGLGVIVLVRSLIHASQPAENPALATSPAQACSNCGRPVQNDWSHCPYCGNPLVENPGDASPAP